MANRTDDASAKSKISDAGSQVFGRMVYKAATIRETCRVAGVNIAAVNYHFGGKKELCRTVVTDLLDHTFRRYPVDAGIDSQARTRDAAARAGVALARQRVADSQLSAPFGGIVLSKSAEPGAYLNPVTPVLTVGDIQNLWLRAFVAERDLGRIRIGQSATVRMPIPSAHGQAASAISALPPNSPLAQCRAPKNAQTLLSYQNSVGERRRRVEAGYARRCGDRGGAVNEITDTTVIAAEAVRRTFGETTAVDDISLSVQRGEICSLVGPDGAGKTTTLRMLAGLLDPTGERMRVAGCNLPSKNDRVKSHLAHMSQRFGLYPDLTVDENIHFYADLYGMTHRQRRGRLDELLDFSNMHPFRMLCVLLAPSSDGGRVAGCDIVSQAEAIKQRIGYMSQKFCLYDDLTVSENIAFYGRIYGLGGNQPAAGGRFSSRHITWKKPNTATASP